jgi:rhomboid family GlyGly-CTERM serine protease
MLLNGKEFINRHGNMMLPWRTGLLVIIAAALYIFAGPAPETLVYSRTDIASGEWWRLITAHWVHSDSQHALWDVSALAILGIYSERYLGKRLFIYLFSASLLISLSIWTFLPWLEYYCGLSGILHTLLITGMMANWHDQQDPVFLLIIGLATLKTVIEVYSGIAIFSNTTWPSLPLAHLYGLIQGGFIITWTLRRNDYYA